MPFNQNAGYGRVMLGVIAESAPGPFAGKVFMVAPSSHPNYQHLQEVFTPDPDGTIRLFTTLAAAETAATASRGDTIFVAEGYTETIVGAAGHALSKAGLTIVGLGSGTLRPKFTFTTSAAASFDISGANTYLKNLVFTNGIDAQTAMINVTSADVTFDGVEVNAQTTTTGAVLGILTAATATRLKIVNSRFLGVAGTSGGQVTAMIQHESGVDYIIQNNYFTGKMTQAILNVATVLRGLVDSNRAVIGTGTLFATFAAASTPFITNNWINVPSGTTPITAAAGFVAGNKYSAAAGVTAGTAVTI